MTQAAWMQTYDAVFFVSVGTLIIGFFGLVIKYCLKSKCENVKLCFGAIEINRRVDLETQVEMHEMDVGLNIDDTTDDEESARRNRPPPSSLPKKRLPKGQLKMPTPSYLPKDLPLQVTNQDVQENPPVHSGSISNSEL